jgi:hypothetical protein
MECREKGALSTLQNRRALQSWLIRSTLVSVSTWIGGPTPAAAQNTGNQASTPAIAYVSNGGGMTEIHTMNNSVIAPVPFPNNVNAVVVTLDGTRMYATKRDIGQVAVSSASTNVAKSCLSNGGSQ